MRSLAIALLLVSATHLWSQDAVPHELLSKEAEARFRAHAQNLYFSASKLETDLQLSIPDERVRLHLPKRGFPHLASLVYNSDLYTHAESTLFIADETLKTCSREEAISEELLGRTMVVRLAANNYACFEILKELAPTPEAMKFEAQAKELSAKLFFSGTGYNPSEVEFLQGLESIRVLFDQLRELPKLTAKQLADERAETAMLAPIECGTDNSVSFPNSGRKWLDRELKWHREWDHHGYLLAFSEITGPGDYEQLKMVVNLKGGIFEWNRPYSGSHDHPNSYESKLADAEFQHLKDFLAKLPSSDATGEKNHFVVSFLRDGRWTTRTYNTLPVGSPFGNLLMRMVDQSANEWHTDSTPGTGFLKP